MAALSLARADPIQVAGANSLVMPVSEAAKVVGPLKGVEFQFSTANGSLGGIEALGEHRAEAALAVATMTGPVRAKYPDVLFTPVFLGRQAVALAVSDDLWQAGIKSITREQLRKIYQKRVKNWKDVGGPDRPISFVDWSSDSGNWQLYGDWLYGDNRRTPRGNFPVVEDLAGALKTIAEKPGSIGLVPLQAVNDEKVHALQVPDKDEKLIEPTVENVAKGIYPINRPLFIVTNDRANGPMRDLIAYLLAPEGQALMHQFGYFSAAELKPFAEEPQM